MASVEKIAIFLASPGDVNSERAYAREVIEGLNRTVGRQKGVHMEIYGWETDTYPSFGSDAQSVVNNQIADMNNYDLFVGIMWNRFGKSTPRADSGTEEEFNLAFTAFQQNGRPDIMFYFGQHPFNLTSPQEAEQKMNVLSFKKKLQESGGLTWEYNDPIHFRTLFQEHLLKWLAHKTIHTPEPPAVVKASPQQPVTKLASEPVVKVPKTVSDSGMWVMLGEGFYQAEEVEEKDDKTIMLQILPKSAAEDAAFKALQFSIKGQIDLVPYAHQNSAGIVRVLAANRRSVAGKSFWTLNLQLAETKDSMFGEITINNVSPDRVAHYRARLLLLDEPPQTDQADVSRFMRNTHLHLPISSRQVKNNSEKGIFPVLWTQFKGRTEGFLPLARLWAVYHLISTRTCEHILDLTLGPLQGNKLHVYFQGRRHKKYSNQDPAIIELEGDCTLE